MRQRGFDTRADLQQTATLRVQVYKAYLSSWSKFYIIPALVMALNLGQQGMVVRPG